MTYRRLLLAGAASIALCALSCVGASAGNLRVGASRVDISPPAGSFPTIGGYPHETLYLRAIVLDNGEARAALISADLGGINEEVWADATKRIAGQFNIPVENVILSSIHTHSDYPANAATPPGMPRYGSTFVADSSVSAVKQALDNLKAAKVGYDTGELNLNVNRDVVSETTKRWTQAANPDAPSDKTVSVLSFVGEDGQPIAAYVTYAMHPINGYLAGFVSGDFAEAMSSWVEKSFGGKTVALFSQAASGDQNPRWLRTGTNALASKSGVKISGYELTREAVEAPLRNKQVPDGPLDPEVGHQLGDYMQALGIVLGEEVIRVMSHTRTFEASPAIWGKQTTLTCPGRNRLDNAREGVAGRYEDGPDVAIRLGVLGIGTTAIGTTNGEVYTRIGQKLKERSPLSHTMYVTLANGRALSGYIPDDESYGHETFQVLGTKLKPGCAEDGISDGIAGLVADYVKNR